MPLTFPLPQSVDDAKDGYIHLCISHQVEGVLERFFAQEDSVTLIKLVRKKIEPFKIIRWEGEASQFPHLYGADLEQSEVERDGVRQLDGHESGSSWQREIRSLGSWLQN